MAISKTLRAATLAVATVLAGGFASEVRAQNSPVGTWDVVLSGGQIGVAQITFVGDFSLTGTEIITARPSASSTTASLDPRGGGDSGRGGVPTNSTPATNFFGAASLAGTWTYDSSQRVVGVITEQGGEVTNGISFVAVVRPGVRLTMNGTRQTKHIAYRGIPLVSLASFSGNYYSTGRRKDVDFTEVLTLSPGLDPNSYDVVGVGPAYNLAGSIMVSGLKRFAYSSVSDETTNGVLRAVSGSFNLTRGSGHFIGVSEDPSGGVPLKVTGSITKQ